MQILKPHLERACNPCFTRPQSGPDAGPEDTGPGLGLGDLTSCSVTPAPLPPNAVSLGKLLNNLFLGFPLLKLGMLKKKKEIYIYIYIYIYILTAVIVELIHIKHLKISCLAQRSTQ